MTDLLLSGLVHSTKKKLDWTKGRAVARKLPIKTVEQGIEECFGMVEETAAGNRSQLNTIISELKAELAKSSPESRDQYTWVIGAKTLHIRGGNAYNGEDPSHGWTVFTNAYTFPMVLKAIGFDVEVSKPR